MTPGTDDLERVVAFHAANFQDLDGNRLNTLCVVGPRE